MDIKAIVGKFTSGPERRRYSILTGVAITILGCIGTSIAFALTPDSSSAEPSVAVGFLGLGSLMLCSAGSIVLVVGLVLAVFRKKGPVSSLAEQPTELPGHMEVNANAFSADETEKGFSAESITTNGIEPDSTSIPLDQLEQTVGSDFISLTCPSCGGKLQVTTDTERFACPHCGNEHLLRKTSGGISLAPVTENLRRIQAGTDKTAGEMKYARLNNELQEIEKQMRFLFNISDKNDVNFLRAQLPGLLVKTKRISTWEALRISGPAALAKLGECSSDELDQILPGERTKNRNRARLFDYRILAKRRNEVVAKLQTLKSHLDD